jgi:endo-1,4-beta-xylanase
VVNEAIDDGNGYLRKTKWLTSIGEDFIAEAFIAARKADPKAELYYNDYNIERQPKRDKTRRLIRDLKQRGAPVHVLDCNCLHYPRLAATLHLLRQ